MRRSDVDLDIFPLDIAEIAERLAKRPQRLWATDEKDADVPHPLALLRPRRERPGCRRATEQRDELAPSDVTCHAPSLGDMPSQTISIICVSCALATIPLLSFDIRPISRAVEGSRPRLYADVTTLKLNPQHRR